MSNCVPDFHDVLDDYDVPTSSVFSRSRKLDEEDMMELMWQNGQVVVQRTSTKNGTFAGGEPVEEPVMLQQNNEEQQQQNRLFMQEDEMASWLHYPLDDSDFCADMLYSAPPPPVPITAPEPVITERSEISQRNGFGHFSRMHNRPVADEVAAPAVVVVERSTLVESSLSMEVRAFHPVVESLRLVNPGSGVSGGDGDIGRKRKDKEGEDSKSQSAGIEFEAAEAKKQAPGSSSTTKRSRAAEVHSLSERRRRDRINEKMKALQQLIPRCNKIQTDKASMLDEAIEYLKSLQMQVQMMSMGYGMMPMMYPGMQQYMPVMGMGMGMNRPMVPYPPTVQGSGIPNPAAAAHMGPRFPMPAFNFPPVQIPDPSRIHASNQVDPMLSSQMPNLVDPHQQFIGLQQAHLPLPQNPLVGRANTDNFNTSQETGNVIINKLAGTRM